MTEPTTSVDARARELRDFVGGSVFLPGGPGYDRARVPWNLAVEQRPSAVAVPTSAADVVRVVRGAREVGLKVAPQSTGHNPGPLAGRLEGTVLVRMSDFTGLSIDAERRVARTLGGTAWQQVIEESGTYGLTALHGSGPDVAVAGYTLGGGLSWYARRYGLACNRVDAIELVMADGRLHRVHADHEPEVFWGLRGGGGNFGVVTAIEMRLLPFREVYAGVLMWDAAMAGRVCRAWADWTHDLAEDVTTSLRLLGSAMRPATHSVFPGRQMVVIDGAVLGDEDLATHLLAPIRALNPVVDTFTWAPARAVTRLHFDPELPTPMLSDHLLLDDFDAGAADAFVATAGWGADSTLVSAEIRHLGGALGRRDASGGALNQLPGAYAALFLAGASPQHRDRGRVDATAAADALRPWSSGRRYLNFSETPVEVADAFNPGTLARLQLLRGAVDPTGLFAANHPV